MDTLFEILCLFYIRVRHLICLGHIFIRVLVFFKKKIMEDIVRTQKQKKLNTILQNKESIYTLNSISTFKN